MAGNIADGDSLRIARLDAWTHALEVLNYAHHEIHGGSAYTACKIFTLGVGATDNILIVTPNTTKWAHFTFSVVSDAVVQVDLYEATGLTGGAALTAYNRNRNSSNSSGLTLTSTTTGGSGDGTLIWTFKAGANKAVVQSETSDRLEFILKQNTAYQLKITGANTDIVTGLLDWYEHTNKD
jgi:hypothetical protein